MDWLRKHWKGAAGVAGIVGTAVVSKVVDHYLDVSVFSGIGSALVSAWKFLSASISVPTWLAGLICLALLILSWARYQEQKAQNVGPTLSATQIDVLQAIAWFGEQQVNAFAHNLKFATSLTSLEVESAIDVLVSRNLVDWDFDINAPASDGGILYKASLTAAGRLYILDNQLQPKL